MIDKSNDSNYGSFESMKGWMSFIRLSAITSSFRYGKFKEPSIVDILFIDRFRI